MSEMVERVARAYEPELWAEIDKHLGGCDKPETAHFARQASLHRARSAVTAMREPTEAMLSRGYEASLDYDRRFDMDQALPAKVWQAMLDEALKE